MKHKSLRSGFLLLELVMGLLISTILISLAFAIYQQITKSVTKIRMTTSDDTQYMVLHDRLQQDLLGMSIEWFMPLKNERSKSVPLQHDDEKGDASQEKSDSFQEKSRASKTDQEQDVQKKLQQDLCFYATKQGQDQNLELFSCMTTSALKTYGFEPKPRVRVVYSLKKNKENAQDFFTLYRTEIAEQDVDPEQWAVKGKGYALVESLKSCKVRYGFIEQADAKKTKDLVTADDKKPKLVWLEQWHSKQEVKKPLIPEFLQIDLVFVHTKNEQESRTCCLQIALATADPLYSFDAQREKKKREAAASPATPAAAGSPVMQNVPVAPNQQEPASPKVPEQAPVAVAEKTSNVIVVPLPGAAHAS